MNFSKSGELYARALKVTPMGAQTASKAPGRVGPIGAFPLYVQEVSGPFLIDVDGNEFIDWFNGNCAVILGPAEAAFGRFGALPSLPTLLEVQTAEKLVELIPCAEQVRFLKTGSEATEAAIRIARMATGRDAIAVIPSQYNGWHSWSVARCNYAPGVPSEYSDLLRPFKFNDLSSFEKALDVKHGAVLQWCELAAVILEPTTGEPPAPGFLEGVNELAHKAGALVIHDNMITGMRWSIAGSDYFGVQPDLACYGKAFANGFPLAFVCGPADLMKHAAVVSGTYGGEVTGLAACQAVLSIMDDAAIAKLWQIGQMLMDGFNGTAQRLKLPVVMESYACRPKARWTVEAAQLPYVIALFQQELASNGVLAHPSGWNPSLAHEGAPLLATLRGVARALDMMACYLAQGDLAKFLKGELLKPAFGRTT